MVQENSIGKWSAKFDESGIIPYIMIEGTFPTNGEKPLYHIRRNEPQGTNPTELLLTLIFGNLADPEGQVNFSVAYSEYATRDMYKTILIVDEDGRHIASESIVVLKSQERELINAQ